MSNVELMFNPELSTDNICRGEDTTRCLTDELNAIDASIAALQSGKADADHGHSGYMLEGDAMDAFALTVHTHDYAASTHTHADLMELVDALDTSIAGKANASHTHAQSEIVGLPEKLAEIDTAIEALQAAGGESGGEVAPMLIASMHLGRLDNNNGAETSSSTRICSEPFAVEPGRSYYQVNDNGVEMYALIYDADEIFLGYLGKFASGAEIAVTDANAAYMRLSSLIGNYDLNNEFRIYNVDPAGGTAEEEGFTQADADLLYAPIDHTHNGFAASEHTHDGLHAHANQAVLDGITAEKVAAWDAGTGASGEAGADGEDGGYYTVGVTQPSASTMKLSFIPSKADMPAIADQTITLPAGEDGEKGEDGTSPAVSVSTISGGHRITITSANGTQYFDVMDGEDGADGQDGADGDDFSGALASDILRLNGTQAIFKSSTMMTLGTNNLETMIAGSKIYSKVTISVSSDERLKENIEAVDADKCVALIDGIDVKTFNYIGNDAPCMGVIAQDLQRNELADFFVSTGETGYLSVKAADLVFPLIAAVQKLSKRVQELESK